MINGLSDLKECVASSKEIALHKECDENLCMKHNHIGNCFNPVVDVSEKEKELVKWIFLIVRELTPLLVVEIDSYCSFHGSNMHFISKMIRATLLIMTKMVEAVIGEEMELSGRGQVMHDGRKKNGVHFLVHSNLITDPISAQ